MPEARKSPPRPRRRIEDEKPQHTSFISEREQPSSYRTEESHMDHEERPIVQPEFSDFGTPYTRGASSQGKPAFVKGILIIAAIAVIAGVAGYFFSQRKSFLNTQTGQKFYAVFLTSGQTFFGTLVREDSANLVLDNVFYVQLVNETVPGTEEGKEPQVVQRPQLIKKGDEFYGPESTIRINRSQVVVIEELRQDSDILRQIQARLQATAQPSAPQR